MSGSAAELSGACLNGKSPFAEGRWVLPDGCFPVSPPDVRDPKNSCALFERTEQMNVQKRRGGFTLIEVLIVVVIMAVLAATIVPQFTNSSKDARESSVKFNLHTLRNTLQMYKLHHMGIMPTGANNLDQLTGATNQTGTVGAEGPSFPYGPYIQDELPTNPFTNSNKVTLFTGTGLPSASGASDAGWI
jgi:type II secretion system protein G